MGKYPDTMPAQNPKTDTKPLGFRPKLRYRKITKGSLYLWNAIIKPGQIVLVYPEDIPEVHRSQFECLDGVELQEAAKPENEIFTSRECVYVLQDLGDGTFNVVNGTTGKVINENPLEKSAAEELCTALNE